MLRAHIKREREIPWWAVIGAPLVGVPAVVALLALVAPGERVTEDIDEVDFAVEQVELEPVSSMPAPQALEFPGPTFRG